MTHDKTKCEYCGEKLPLGLNKLSRQIRSRHFENCAARDLKLESLKNDAWNKGVCPVCNTEDGQVEKLEANLAGAKHSLEAMNEHATHLQAQLRAQDALLRQALKALSRIEGEVKHPTQSINMIGACMDAVDAINAIKEHLK